MFFSISGASRSNGRLPALFLDSVSRNGGGVSLSRPDGLGIGGGTAFKISAVGSFQKFRAIFDFAVAIVIAVIGLSYLASLFSLFPLFTLIIRAVLVKPDTDTSPIIINRVVISFPVPGRLVTANLPGGFLQLPRLYR